MTINYKSVNSPVALLGNIPKPLLKSHYCANFTGVKMEVGSAFPIFGTIDDLSVDYSSSMVKKQEIDSTDYLKITLLDAPALSEKKLSVLLPLHDDVRTDLIREIESVLIKLKRE